MSEGMTARERAAAERFGHDPTLWGIRERADFLAGWDAALAAAEAMARDRIVHGQRAGHHADMWDRACRYIADAIAALRKGGA